MTKVKQESGTNGQEFQWNFQTLGLSETEIYNPQGIQILKKPYIAQY